MDPLKKLQELYGITVTVPQETQNDLAREGQAVLNYFQSKGEGFTKIPCKNCNLVFAYAWDVKGVQYCSIRCMDIALQKIGLCWNPTKPPHERWGRTVPAVVPPAALTILEAMVDTQEVPDHNTDYESDLDIFQVISDAHT